MLNDAANLFFHLTCNKSATRTTFTRGFAARFRFWKLSASTPEKCICLSCSKNSCFQNRIAALVAGAADFGFQNDFKKLLKFAVKMI
jgi:hypothetical protein